MIEVYGNIWSYPANARVITTNGFVKKNGEAVMGAGVAKEAKTKYPVFPKWLGSAIKEEGNNVHCFGFENIRTGKIEFIYTFPVKHNWWEDADLELIERSCEQLVEQAVNFEDAVIVIPRPGCGNGKRDWETEVKPILEKHLDDRFHVIHYG
jgi:kynurenine formamidase